MMDEKLTRARLEDLDSQLRTAKYKLTDCQTEVNWLKSKRVKLLGEMTLISDAMKEPMWYLGLIQKKNKYYKLKLACRLNNKYTPLLCDLSDKLEFIKVKDDIFGEFMVNCKVVHDEDCVCPIFEIDFPSERYLRYFVNTYSPKIHKPSLEGNIDRIQKITTFLQGILNNS